MHTANLHKSTQTENLSAAQLSENFPSCTEHAQSFLSVGDGERARPCVVVPHAVAQHTVRTACSRYTLVTDCDRLEVVATLMAEGDRR